MCFLRLAFTLATVTGWALAEAAWQLERNGYVMGQRVIRVLWGKPFTEILFTVWFMSAG